MPAPPAARVAAVLAALLGGHAAGQEPPVPGWGPVEVAPDPDALPPGAFARLGSARFKSPDDVQAVAVSGDGRAVATATPHDLILWDAATGRERCRYRSGPFHTGLNVRIAAGGNTLVAANHTPTLRVVDMASGRSFALTAPGDGEFESAAARPDGGAVAAVRGRRAVAAGGRAERWYDIVWWPQGAGGKPRVLDAGRQMVFAAALSPDGRGLADRREDGRVHLWDRATGLELRSFPTGLGSPGRGDVRYSADGRALLLSGPDDEVAVLDADTGDRRLHLPGTSDGWPGADLSPDGRTVAVGAECCVRLHRVADGREVRRFAEPGNRGVRVAFGPGGRTLVTGGTDRQVRVWDVGTGRPRVPVVGHALPVTALAYSADGRVLASADCRGTVRLWDARANRERCRLPELLRGAGLALSPDGSRLATASDQGVAVWDTATGRRAASGPAARPASRASYVSGGRSLVCVEGDDVVWRDPATLAVERRLRAPAANAAVAVDGRGAGGVAVATPHGGEWRPWDPAGRPTPSWRLPWVPLPTAAALSPDGRFLAVGGPGSARLWDAGSRAELNRWETGSSFRVGGAVAFSADGRLFAFVDNDRKTRVLEVATGGEVACVPTRLGSPAVLVFAPDGRALAAVEWPASILLWDLGGTHAGGPRPAPGAAERAGLWDGLLDPDPARAYCAVCRLAEAPAEAVPFLRERLRPAEPFPAERVGALVAALDDRRFAVRQSAFRALSEAREPAEGGLRKAARAEQSAEAREALGKLLKALDAERLRPTGERLRAARAVQALEYMRIPESRELLGRLAGGAAGATLTREARAALEREVLISR